MKALLACGLGILLVVGVATGGDDKADLDKLQGSWAVDKDGKKAELKFEKDKFTLYLDGEEYAFREFFKLPLARSDYATGHYHLIGVTPESRVEARELTVELSHGASRSRQVSQNERNVPVVLAVRESDSSSGQRKCHTNRLNEALELVERYGKRLEEIAASQQGKN